MIVLEESLEFGALLKACLILEKEHGQPVMKYKDKAELLAQTFLKIPNKENLSNKETGRKGTVASNRSTAE